MVNEVMEGFLQQFTHLNSQSQLLPEEHTS
jgi:hypothetical protein